MKDKYLGKDIVLNNVDVPITDNDTGVQFKPYYATIRMEVLEYVPELDKYICELKTGDEYDGCLVNVTRYALDRVNWGTDNE